MGARGFPTGAAGPCPIARVRLNVSYARGKATLATVTDHIKQVEEEAKK
jgi:hypothetical protein